MTKQGMSALFAAIAAAVLAAGTPAFAQSPQQGAAQQELSEQEAKDFLSSVEEDMTEAINAGDYDRVVDWTRQSIAEGAIFSFNGEIYVGDQRKGFAALSLNKQDMLQMTQAAVGILAGAQGQQVQDYSLDIEVVAFRSIGPNAATVETQISEKGTLAAPGDESKPVQVVSTADCTHVIQKSAKQVMLGMSNCQARTEF